MVKSINKYYNPRGTKHSRECGMTIKEMCDHYDTYNKNIWRWRQLRPDLSYEEWEMDRRKINYPSTRKKVVSA